MRHAGSTRLKIFGLILAIGIAVTLPYVVFGAARTSSSVGRLRAPMTRPQRRASSPRFHHPGFWGVGGFGDGTVTIIQQVPPVPTVETRERSKNTMYVPPRWVDGGNGVQISVPGYWTRPEPGTKGVTGILDLPVE